jgi:hypothetical protein
MEETIEVHIFLEMLRQKTRDIAYTRHSIRQAKMRKIIADKETKIEKFEKDFQEEEPYCVVEQTSETVAERKFKLYYRSHEGGFVVYIISMDGQIRLITVYRTTKSIQEKVYKYAKREGYR